MTKTKNTDNDNNDKIESLKEILVLKLVEFRIILHRYHTI